MIGIILGICAVAAVAIRPAFLLMKLWTRRPHGQFTKDVKIDGKIVIITGGSTGIGFQAALDLAKRGGRIYLACRNLVKTDVACKEIIHQSENENVYSKQLDLSSFESIRNFVDEKCETKLHILINNAAKTDGDGIREVTKDGLEAQIGTNHFGHFLLTNLLLDMLKASAPSRIVNVSSYIHRIGRIHRDDMQLEKSYGGWTAYTQSKLANVLFTRELAKRLKGTNVTANSLCPGDVATDRNLSLYRYIFHDNDLAERVEDVLFKTVEEGAQTTIMLAVDPDLENVTGKYFSDCAIQPESKAAQDDETAAWLWKESERITKLKQ